MRVPTEEGAPSESWPLQHDIRASNGFFSTTLLLINNHLNFAVKNVHLQFSLLTS